MNKYIVRDVVCDWGICSVDDLGKEELVEVCNSKANAELICEILNADLMKDGKYTIWKDKEISDLETKLAESEENNKLLEMQLQDMERSKLSWENQYFTLYNTLKNYREVTEKKHLLDEKEWQDYCAFKHIEPQIKGCLDREKEYEKQLAELEKENDELQDKLHSYYEQIMNKGTCGLCEYVRTDYKISFSVEQLEKIRHNILCNEIFYFENLNKYMDEQIDNQIKQLKEMK